MIRVHKIGFIFFLILSLSLLVTACSRINQTNFEKIKSGMSMQEVVAILGEPTSSDSINLGIFSGTSATWKDTNAEITVQFLNDKVEVKSFSKAIDEHHRSEKQREGEAFDF